MAQPVIYVTTLRIRDGMFPDYQRFYSESLKVIDDNEPRLIAFHTFANEDRTEITNVQVHPDTASMDSHMQLMAERMGVLADDLTKVLQFLEPVRVEVCGDPGERAMAMDRPLIEGGIAYGAKPFHLGGFSRPTVS